MSDVNKIVAAIISTARAPGHNGPATVETRIRDYQQCLKALKELEDQDEPVGPDTNAIKADVNETLDQVPEKK